MNVKTSSKPGVGATLKEVGSRLLSVTQKRNQGWFKVTHGYASSLDYAPGFPVTYCYVSRLRSLVSGYVLVRMSVTKPDSRLRIVT